MHASFSDPSAPLMTALCEARARRDDLRALRLIHANWVAVPDPMALAVCLADVLHAMGRDHEAGELYELCARHFGNCGQPLAAMAAARMALLLDSPAAPSAIDHLAYLYGARMEPSVDGSRPSGPEGLRAALDLEPGDVASDPQRLVSQMMEWALSHEGPDAPDPATLPAVPLLGVLSPTQLGRALELVEVESNHADPESRQAPRPLEFGPLGEDLVWVADGPVVLTLDEQQWALGPGALLNVMARTGDSARAVEIQAGPHSRLLRMTKASINALCEEFPDLGNRLATFRRHALTEGFMARHGIFEGMDLAQRRELMAHFCGLRVASGEVMIRQGRPSPGLFVVLDGKVEIVRRDGDWEITVATLLPGEIAGEIGLVSDQPATASVAMAVQGHVLYLSRQDFGRLALQYPSMARYTVNLAVSRMAEMKQGLGSQDLMEVEEA